MPDKKTLSYYTAELRRIEESRQADTEKEVKKIYKEILKDLNGFLGNEYASYSNNEGVLSVAVLQEKARYAKFLQEVDQHLNSITPKISKTIKGTVQDTYNAVYAGMVDAVTKSVDDEELVKNLKGLSLRPEVMKRAIENPISGLTLPDTLEKHRKEVIYNIKQQINIGLMTGERYDTMAKNVKKAISGDDGRGGSYGKAMNIVRTEVHRVQESGMMDCAEDISPSLEGSGLIYTATWRNMGDANVRPSYRVHTSKGWKTVIRKTTANHQKMEGVTIRVGDKFDLGNGVFAKCPGSSGTPENDCRCRCYLEYELMTVEEFAKATGKTVDEVKKEFGIVDKDKSTGKDLKIDTPSNKMQNYKPVTVDLENQNIVKRSGKNITVSRLTNTQNKVYISSEAKIKPKQQQELDRNITSVLDMLKVKDKSIQPMVAILSDYEMANNAVASYNPIQNVLYVRQSLLDYNKLPILQEQLACADDKHSTILHEYIHWLDAEKYRTKNGGFNSPDDYSKYINELRAKCKVKLDNAGIDEYNVLGISEYASDEYKYGKYDETYTEYRVKKFLGE